MPATRMAHTGDVARARAEFPTRRGDNLRFLLRKRFGWMRPYLKDGAHVVEVGCGTGLSREFLDHPGLELTDVTPNPWVDRVVDALRMPYEAGSLDAVISNNMIHHLAKPQVFFREVDRSSSDPAFRSSWCSSIPAA
jgi:2-polyprenyl-3-methyl-5-hydroxy-6-metoxy-1,4-benzoquinol methylase